MIFVHVTGHVQRIILHSIPVKLPALMQPKKYGEKKADTRKRQHPNIGHYKTFKY